MKKQQKKKLLAAATMDAATTPEASSQDANQDSRRTFLRNGLLAAAGFYIVPRSVLGRGFTAPSDKLQIAGIGAGGKGESDLYNFFMSGKADIVALADVDSRQTAKSRARSTKANVYEAFREMLEQEKGRIDALSVFRPDPSTAIAYSASVQFQKSDYVQTTTTHQNKRY